MSVAPTPRDRFGFDVPTPNPVVLGAVLGLCLVAYGFLAFNLTLAGDDWAMVRDPTDHYAWFVRIGRWMAVLLWLIFYDNRFAPAVTLFTALGLMSVGAVVAARAAGARNAFQQFVYAALLVLNPVLAEELSFKSNHLAVGFGVLFASWSAVLCHEVVATDPGPLRGSRTALRLGGACLLLVLATGCQQSLFLFGVVTMLASALYLLREARGAPEFNALARRLVVCHVSVTIAALVVYLATTVVVRRIAGLTAANLGHYAFEESLVASGGELLAVLDRFSRYLVQFGLLDQHLWPGRVKIVFLLVFACYAVVMLRPGPSPRGRGSLAEGVLLVMILAGFVVAPWALGIVRTQENSYRYNALLGLLPFYPAVFVQAMHFLRSPRIRAGIGVAAAATIFSFAFFQNVAAIATHTTNQRDRAVAARILSRVEQHPDFADFSRQGRQHVLLVGELVYDFDEDVPFQQRADAPMATSIVNCGVFNCQSQRFKHLMSFVDYPSAKRTYGVFHPRDLEEMPDRSAVAAAILHAAEWPDEGSIAIVGDRAFVVLHLSDELRERLESVH